jgi:hypothetical protein
MTSNNDVAQEWARGSDQSYRGSNFFSEGPHIYSYGHHWLLGHAVAGGFVINTAYYSKSTSKHLCYVRGAAAAEDPRGTRTIAVPRDFTKAMGMIPPLGSVLRAVRAPAVYVEPAQMDFIMRLYPQLDRETCLLPEGAYGGDPKELRRALTGMGDSVEFDDIVAIHLRHHRGLDAAMAFFEDTAGQDRRRWQYDGLTLRMADTMLALGATSIPKGVYQGMLGRAWDHLMDVPDGLARATEATAMALSNSKWKEKVGVAWLRNHNFGRA